MAIFNVTEKQQKSHFFLQFFLLKTLLPKKKAQKSTFSANFSPSPSLSANLFALIRLPGSSYSLSFSPQPLQPTTKILHLLCSSVVATSKICRGGHEIHPDSSPKATSFRGGHFSRSTSNRPNSLMKYNT